MAEQTMDEKVIAMLQLVKKQQEDIKAAEKRPVWKTNCTISLVESASLKDRRNIQTINDPSELVNIYGFLLNRESVWRSAAEALGFDEDSSYQGYPISDWKADLRTRASQISLKEKKDKLKALNKRIDGLVSPEQRREMELKAIQEELGV